MKTSTNKLTLAFVSFLVIVSSAAPRAAEQTWTGQISDSLCGAKHEEAAEGQGKMADRDCTLACVRGGSKLVLVVDGKMLPIANQESHRFRVLRQGPRQLPGLLDDPWRARIRRATRQMHTTATQLDEEEHVEPFQPDRLDGEEIDREHAAAVRSHELAPRRRPALTRRSEASGPKPRAHGRRRHRDTKTLQFADNPWIAPSRVLSGEPQYEVSNLTPHRRRPDGTGVRPPLGD